MSEIHKKYSVNTLSGYIDIKKDDFVFNCASFNGDRISNYSLPDQFFSIFKKQILEIIEHAKENGTYEEKEIWPDGILKDEIEFNKLQNIEIGDTIYKFVPNNRKSDRPFYLVHTNIDIVVNQAQSNFPPDKILEGYIDYSIPIAKMKYIDSRQEFLDGYTNGVEIDRLRKQCERLKKIIVNIQMQINTDTQENIYKGVKNK